MDSLPSGSTSDGSSNQTHNKKVFANTSSSTSNVSSANAGPSNLVRKHIIRRITPLDIQKIQQAGLDRKLAEALSKHKYEERNKVLNQAAIDLKSTSNKDSPAETSNSIVSKPTSYKISTMCSSSTRASSSKLSKSTSNTGSPTSSKISSSGAIYSTVSKPTNVQEEASAKTSVISYKIKPPKITITGPDALSEIEKQKLANLNPRQRLVHVKNILNKKLLEKVDPEMSDTVKNKQHLKPPATIASTHVKLLTKEPQENPVTKKVSSVLKNQAAEHVQKHDDNRLSNSKKEIATTTPIDKTLTPTCVNPTQSNNQQKYPKDIARKLDFQIEMQTQTAQSGKHQQRCLNKNVGEIPKAAIKAPIPYQQNTSAQSESVLPPKQSYYIINTNFQNEYVKQQQREKSEYNIPKASIKKKKEQFSSLFSKPKQRKRSEILLEVPEVSPLKVNVPKDTPLPAIYSFKKPYSLGNPKCYESQHKTVDQSDLILTSSFNQHPTTVHLSQSSPASTLTNSLIVLENKILSQDEMIDLTELRLSKSKFDSPGFMNPHRPIPEVVIKQEKTDEYTDPVKLNSLDIRREKNLQEKNSDIGSGNKFTISNKHNKRVVINAQKLTVTPQQLAEIEKKMKQQSCSASLSAPATKMNPQADKLQNVSNQNSKADGAQPFTKHMEYILPQNTGNIAQTAKEIPQEFVIADAPVCHTVQDNNYQHQQINQDYFEAGQPHVVNEALTGSNKSLEFETFSNDYSYYESQNTVDDTSYFEVPENSANRKHEAVEIVDEPIEAEDGFSAVDFILALGNTNPITEEKSLEISPEEHNLNASCAINLSPICKQANNPTNTKELISFRRSAPIMSTSQSDNSLKIQQKNTTSIGSSNSPNERPIKGVDDLKNANKLQTDASGNSSDSNLLVCDMDIEESSGNLLIGVNEKNREGSLKNITTTQKTNGSNEIIEVLHSDSNSNPLNLSKNDTNSKAVLKSCMKKADLPTTTSKLSDNELQPRKIDDNTKFPQGIVASKTSEMSNNTTATTKRLSRFKKGKINLVQRNKTGQLANNALTDDKKTVVNNKSGNETLNNEHKVDPESKVEEKSEKSLIILNNEMSTVPTPTTIETIPTGKTSCLDVNKIKETKLNKTSVSHTIDITDNKLLTPMATVHSVVNIISEIQSSSKDTKMISQVNDINTSPQKLGLPQTSSSSSSSSSMSIKTTSIKSPDITDVLVTHSSPSNISKQLDSNKIHECKTQEALAENLNTRSKSILSTMKTAKISLMDIVKHSPIKITESCPPVIPFKKTSSETTEISTEVKGIKTLANQLKSCHNENDIEKSMEEKKILPNTSGSLSQAETPASNVSTQKRNSTEKRLITDDDLEFLPENVEYNLMHLKSKQNEKTKECKKEVKHDRRQSLYSQPIDVNLFNTPSCSRTKRNRCYTQTLETNVTLTVDALKSKENVQKNIKVLEGVESCHKIKEDSSPITSTKQHKKLRKSIKETQNSDNETDSDDNNRDNDFAMRDCEESNEFLGFDDNPEGGNNKNTQHIRNETEHEETTKHGTLKNWLTTGKAISPTLEQQSRRRLRNEEKLTELSSLAHIASDTKEKKPLKKRYDFGSLSYDETDITDDTSPADDEEEIKESVTNCKKHKRGIENVIDSNRELIDNKKIKLDDSMKQNSVKPRNVKKKTENKNSVCNEKKCGKSENRLTGTESDGHEKKYSEGQQFQVNTEKSGTDSGGRKLNESRHHKNETDNIKNISDTIKCNKTDKADKADKADKTNKSKVKVHLENLLDIPQKQDITEKRKISNDKNENSREVNPRREVEETISKRIKVEPETTFVTPENAANKRKRGRPKKNIIYDSSEDEGRPTSNSRQSAKVSTKRKLTIEDTHDSDSLSTDLNETPTTSSRGRKAKFTESNFNPRLLLITKREQLDTDEILTETETGSGSIQCGLCLKYTQPAKWLLHLAQHYGVGWKVGQEELNIQNRSVVLNTIVKYMKVPGSIEISCRMCKKIYRSALGMLMHIESCGAEAIRVTCEYCNRHYAQSSFPLHMRTCFIRNNTQNKDCAENQNEGNQQKEIFGNSGRLKRNSSIKAENKLKVLGAELENVKDSVKTNIDPKLRIRYVDPQPENFCAKWSKDIIELGQACCPKSHCKFTSNDMKELSAHLKECKFIKSGYICNYCRRAFQSEEEAIAHVVKRHQNRRSESNDSDCDVQIVDEESSDDNDLSEGIDENELTDDVAADEDDVEDVKITNKKGSTIPKASIKSTPTVQTNRKAVFDGRHNHLDVIMHKKWKSFIISNYSSEPIYTEFTTNYSVIKQQDFSKYLPTQTVSMKYSFGTKSTLLSTLGVPQKNIEWSELKRYESINNKMNTYFFLGAPIKLCSWFPLPAYVNEQFLAVVYRQDMFKFTKFTNPKQHSSIVLILKVTRNNEVPELNIHYGFVVNDGPIHHLSFLPSGGYDEASNRLGLVAVATVTTCINVYSLPLNVDNNDGTDNNNITLINVKPSFILNLDMIEQKAEEQQHAVLNPQCLQICWSESTDHQHIFAGFSNGFVGIWEILNNPQENLNHFIVDTVINYAPLNYFYIGEKSVKIAVHYDTSGPRWLAASTAYRKLIIYDIKNMMQPIIMKEDVHKNIALSLDWCPLYENILYTYCDSIQNNGRLLAAVSPNNIMFPHNRIDTLASGVTQVHYNPVINVCVTASNNGDIAFLDTRELHYEYVLGKKFGERRMLYSMDVKQLNGEPLVRLARDKNKKNDDIPSDWIMHDKDYKEKYGVIFQPLLQIKKNDQKVYAGEERAPPLNITPFMRINTVRWNLNLNGYQLIALGYENGFLRVMNFKKPDIFR